MGKVYFIPGKFKMIREDIDKKFLEYKFSDEDKKPSEMTGKKYMNFHRNNVFTYDEKSGKAHFGIVLEGETDSGESEKITRNSTKYEGYFVG